MRRYELVVVVSPEIADDDVPDAVDRLVRKPVESEGGELQEIDTWGRRKLAYPIEKFREGNYVLNQLNMDPQKTGELERGLQISEDVLRHLLIRLEE